MPGPVKSPASEAVLTICPPSPWLSISGTKISTPLATPFRLTSSTQRHSSSVSRSIGAETATPALLTTTWTLPNLEIVSSAALRIESRLDTSATTPSQRICLSRSDCTARVSAPSSISASMTFMPSAPNASAIARPMPLAPPVTNAVLSRNSFITAPFALLQLNGRTSDDLQIGQVGLAQGSRHLGAVERVHHGRPAMFGPVVVVRARVAPRLGEIALVDQAVLAASALRPDLRRAALP